LTGRDLAAILAVMSSDMSLFIRLLKSVPSAYQKVKELCGGLSVVDQQLVKEFVGRLDERRVFHAPYHAERVELVVGSLRRVVEDSHQTLASLSHGPSKAAAGVILDQTRKFLDRWGDARTPTQRGKFPAWFDEETSRFFEDLGELRGQIRFAVEFLQEFADPQLRAPSVLTEGTDGER
jgi:hypothetical protein